MAAKGIVAGHASQPGVFEAYILRNFVDMLTPDLVFAKYCEPATIPKGAGAYICNWNVPIRQATTTALALLSEVTLGATDGEITGVTLTEINGTMADYGHWMKISSLAKAANLKQTMDTYSEQIAEQGASVIDMLCMTAARATTNQHIAQEAAAGGTTIFATSTMVMADIAAVAGFFRANNAKGWPHLNGDYMLAIHPDMEVDLVTAVGTSALSWSEVNQHTPKGYEQLINNHQYVGRYNGVTLLRTTMITAATVTSVSVKANVALARWGVGNAGLGMSGPTKPTIKYKEPGNTDTYQPLDRFCTLGWTVRMVAKLLDASRALTVYAA